MPEIKECEVVAFKNNVTYVRLDKAPDCNGCKACGFGKKQSLVMPVTDELSSKIGDRVAVEMPVKPILSAPFVMYLVPLMLMFAGLISGYFINEIIMMCLAAAGLGIGFLIVFLVDKLIKKNKKVMPKIIEILPYRDIIDNKTDEKEF